MSAEQKVTFIRMDEGTEADYALLEKHEERFKEGLVERILDRLRTMDKGLSGYKVSRLGHSLQTATRARNGGADADWVVAALLHDLGDELAPENHDSLAASIIAPYVREECTWAVRHHGIFQFKYYADKVGLNADERDKYRESPHFEATAYFCERWDQTSFDPDYPTDPLESFEPELREVFSRSAWQEKHAKPGFVTPSMVGAA